MWYGQQWEYVFLRSLHDHEIHLINELIEEFGPIIPRYRTFHIFGNELPYTFGHPIHYLKPLTTPKTIRVDQYPQLHASIAKVKNVAEITRNDAFMWYTEHWFDMNANGMSDSESEFVNSLIFEFGPIIPSLSPDSDEVGDPIISV